MKKYVIAIMLMIIATGAAHADTFERYLQKGDRGTDVTLLQKALNTDPETQIAATGDGSLGHETDFFGELTKQALIKLQKKHSLGNKYGFFTIYSGALDDKTRSFLNGSYTPPDAQEQLNETFRQEQELKPLLPFIESVSPRSIINGDTVTVTGKNFSTTTANTIRLTYNTTSSVSPDGTTLTFKAQSALQDMFEKQAKKLDKDQKDNVKDTMGEMPVFITVQNEKGISNPYQIYLKLK